MTDRNNHDIEALFAGALDGDELVSVATGHEQSAIDSILDGDFVAANQHADTASGIYDRLIQSLESGSPQWLYLNLAWAKVQLCRAAGYRRAGDPAAAGRTFDAGEERLVSIRDTVFGLSEEYYDLIYDWLTTDGALLMNKGVLQSDQGNATAALDTWRQAEEVMFERYIKHLGPEHDVECVAKIINLWENMMVASLDVGQVDTAAQAVGNAMKLYVYWPAHGLDHPEVVVEAIGAFFGGIEGLESGQRKTLDSALPDPLVNMINEILADEA